MAPRLLAWVAVLVALGFNTIARAELKVGDVFPDLTKTAPMGQTKIPDTKGKVLLVDFWASWCAPCKASFPALAKIHREYDSRGVAVLAVGVDEKSAAATAFWKRMNPPFAGVHDAARVMVKQVGVPTMPTSYIVGRDGRVRYIHQGFQGEVTERELRNQLDAALREKAKS